MKEFKDRDGRTWQIDLNIGNVLRVRSTSGGLYDLLDPTKAVGDQPLQVALWDLVRFYDVLWLLVEWQAKREAITEEMFGQSMAADCLLVARESFFDEWRDFFHSLHRPDAALSVESQAKMQAAAVRLVTEKIKQMDQTGLHRKIETQVATAVNAAFGIAQASLDAILAPTPGGSST